MRAHIESVRYEKICRGLKVAQCEALRNRYTLEIYEQTNQLFNYPVRLLLALEAFDKAKDKEEYREALTQIEMLCSYFKKDAVSFRGNLFANTFHAES